MECRSVLGLAGCLAALAACGAGGRDDPPTGQPPPSAPDHDPDHARQSPTQGWRYLPTVREHTPEGLHLEPVLELEEPAAGRVDVIVAVGRPAGPTLELLRLRAGPPDGVLAPEGDLAPLLRVTAAPDRAPGLAEFRSRLAAPRNRVYRPPGLTETDDALLAELSRLARTIRDPTSGPEASARALATLTRGLDDSLLLESDRTHEVIDALLPDPEAELIERGARRSEGRLGTRAISLVKKSGGWMLTSLADGPTRPDPREP